MWLRTLFTAGITFFPSTTIGTLLLFLKATWRTARSSVKLIFSPGHLLLTMDFRLYEAVKGKRPANMASLATSTPLSLARSISISNTSSLILFLL